MLNLIINLLFSLIIVSLGACLALDTPVHLCLSLILLAAVSGGLISAHSSSWVFLALTLVFLGGMMVMFIYVSALTGSSNSLLSVTPAMNALGTAAIFWVFCSVVPAMKFSLPSTAEILYPDKGPVLMMLITFLLLVLFISVKNVQSYKGAMKSHL